MYLTSILSYRKEDSMFAYSVNGSAWEGLAALQARWLRDAVHSAILFVSGQNVSRGRAENYCKGE